MICNILPTLACCLLNSLITNIRNYRGGCRPIKHWLGEHMANDELIKKTDRLRMAIGEIVISFQFIEKEIAEVICGLLHMKEPNDIQRMSSAMSFKQKVDLVCELYPTRRKYNWPEIDVRSVKSALNATEEFRNSIVHSFWYLSGNKRRSVWMRSKSSLRSSSGLTHINGVANVGAMEKGMASMKIIRNWYLGQTSELKTATSKIKAITKKLTRRVNVD